MIHTAHMTPASAEKDETKALARDVSARSVAQLEAGQARIMAENAPNSRWLLSALVLLNGGGIAVTAGATEWLAPVATGDAIGFFAIGAALAVLAGLANALAALVVTRLIAEASAQWAQVASGGAMSDAALKAAVRVRRGSLVASLTSLGIGLLSLILFVAGAMTLGSGLAPTVEVVEEVPVTAPATPAPVASPKPVETPVPSNAAAPAPAPAPSEAKPQAAPPAQRAPQRTPQRQPEPLRAAPMPPIVVTPAPAPAQPALPPASNAN